MLSRLIAWARAHGTYVAFWVACWTITVTALWLAYRGLTSRLDTIIELLMR